MSTRLNHNWTFVRQSLVVLGVLSGLAADYRTFEVFIRQCSGWSPIGTALIILLHPTLTPLLKGFGKKKHPELHFIINPFNENASHLPAFTAGCYCSTLFNC